MMGFVPSSQGMIERYNYSYIPANVPGSQMGFQNLSYLPVVLDGITNMYKKQSYIPCSTSAGCGPFGSTEETVMEYNLGWWEKDRSFFYYPCMLISAFYGMKYPDFRKRFNIPDNFILYGDSGGFQNLSKDRNLSWKDVLEWQERNCNVIFSLDYPIDFCKTSHEIEKFNNKTIRNIENMIDNKRNDDSLYYGCVHAFDTNSLINFYESISDIAVDGYGQGQLSTLKRITIDEKIDRIVLAYTLDDEKRNQHFFGLSSPIAIAVGHFMEKKYRGKFTYDNSNYGRGAIGREYKLDSMKLILNENSPINSLGCDCPVCSQLNCINDMKGEGSVPGALISLHNLWQEIKKDLWIKSLIDSPDDLLRYIGESKFKKSTIQRLDYIFGDRNLDDYHKRFNYKLQMESIRTIRRLDEFV